MQSSLWYGWQLQSADPFHVCHLAFKLHCLVVTSSIVLKSVCMSSLVVPVIRGEVGHGYIVFVFFPYFFLTTFSITSLQLLLSLAVVLHSPPTLSRSLLTQSSHHILDLPRLLFPFSFFLSSTTGILNASP